MAHSNRPRARSRGMVTAELALGILTASMVAIVMCWGIHLIAVQTECADIAAQVARADARGDAAAAADARSRAPAGATVDVALQGTDVAVTVSVPVTFGKLFDVTVTGQATMPKEPGT